MEHPIPILTGHFFLALVCCSELAGVMRGGGELVELSGQLKIHLHSFNFTTRRREEMGKIWGITKEII
jgi:hypothetical protein